MNIDKANENRQIDKITDVNEFTKIANIAIHILWKINKILCEKAQTVI